MIEQTRFRSTLFLCSEYYLSWRIFTRVNFSGKNVCDNFYLRELIFADRWKNRKNRKNWNPQKFRATRYLAQTKTTRDEIASGSIFYISFKVKCGYPGRYFIYDSYSVLIYTVFLLVYRGTWLASVSWPTYFSYLAYLCVLGFLSILAYFSNLACLRYLAYICVLAYFSYLACLTQFQIVNDNKFFDNVFKYLRLSTVSHKNKPYR